jgi:hypothetical protein
LRDAFTALGGVGNWGVEELIPGRLLFDSGVFLEQLFPRVIAMLNRVMDETPVEHLPHVSVHPSDFLPPTESQVDPFVEQDRQSIRWQLGCKWRLGRRRDGLRCHLLCRGPEGPQDGRRSALERSQDSLMPNNWLTAPAS